MFVIEVIPLKRGIFTESLSYYSATSYEPGTLLSIPLRSKETTALVVGSKPVSAAKTALKTATFSLRKLEVQKDTAKLPSSLVATAERMSLYLPASIGAILFSLLPSDIRDGERKYPKTTEHLNTEDSTPRVLTDTAHNRYIAYRSHIRQTFAHRGSVVFVVPTSAAVEEARKKLEVGIENRVITFSSCLTKKQLNESFAAFEDYRHAKLIITTPSFAFLDRHDILTIIVDSCGSSHYNIRTRPYVDVREALKIFAKQTGRSILLGDSVPQTEDEIRRRDDIYATYDEHTKRLELPGTIQVTQHKKVADDEKFTLCTDELVQTINRSLTAKGQVFLYAARRGLAPAVTCYDCGFIFRCPDSGAPYSLLRTFRGDDEERWFVSGTSGKRVRAADVCERCGSWRLREQGIGIQNVYDQISKLFPKTEIFLFDHTTATTYTKAKKIIDQFYATKRSILVGTSMVLPYLSRPVDTSAVMSYEATRAVPTWRADETIFSLLVTLREITHKDVVIQMRTEPDELIELSRRGLIDQFYEGEIAVRKALGYPPYSAFVLLSWSGTKPEVQKIEESIEPLLRKFEPQFYSAPQSNANKTLRYCLIRVKAESWPNSELMAVLRSLPPYIKIEVNPDRIV
jgi:primosomal protein N' (replication factor Y) (superfamily II helicase)